jgi:hypothetical protein
VRLFSFFFFSTFDLLFSQNRGEWSAFNGDQQYWQKQIIVKKTANRLQLLHLQKKSEILFLYKMPIFS